MKIIKKSRFIPRLVVQSAVPFTLIALQALPCFADLDCEIISRSMGNGLLTMKVRCLSGGKQVEGFLAPTQIVNDAKFSAKIDKREFLFDGHLSGGCELKTVETPTCPTVVAAFTAYGLNAGKMIEESVDNMHAQAKRVTVPDKTRLYQPGGSVDSLDWVPYDEVTQLGSKRVEPMAQPLQLPTTPGRRGRS